MAHLLMHGGSCFRTLISNFIEYRQNFDTTYKSYQIEILIKTIIEDVLLQKNNNNNLSKNKKNK